MALGRIVAYGSVGARITPGAHSTFKHRGVNAVNCGVGGPLTRSISVRPETSRSSVRPVVPNSTAIDTIIQSSTVELMRSHRLSVAPRPRVEMVGFVPENTDLVGVVGFHGPNLGGSLTLAVPLAVYDLMTHRQAHNTTYPEWVYELTNQVMGHIKNRLIQFQVKLRTHVPIVLSGAALERHKRRTADEVVYRFGTLREEIAVVVDASLTRAMLEYSNASLLIRGSDVLLFDDPADP
jgi:CheY-specific phosphatase CheX